jgi:hypothetical protein
MPDILDVEYSELKEQHMSHLGCLVVNIFTTRNYINERQDFGQRSNDCLPGPVPPTKQFSLLWALKFDWGL